MTKTQAEIDAAIVIIRKKHAQDVADLIEKFGYSNEAAAEHLGVTVTKVKQIIAGDVEFVATQHLMDMKIKFGSSCGC
ncbi:MAG: XRE family transcriptional regulator [Pseudomonadales bacterium]